MDFPGTYDGCWQGRVTTVIDGFTIRNGSAYSGAGVYCFTSSPTIRNNIILGNASTGPGGGVYAYYGSPVETGEYDLTIDAGHWLLKVVRNIHVP